MLRFAADENFNGDIVRNTLAFQVCSIEQLPRT